MKLRKIIGGVAAAALAASLIPYRVTRDKEAGTWEVRSLLWGVKKTPGEDKDHIAFAIPSSGLDCNDSEEETETPAEAAAEETGASEAEPAAQAEAPAEPAEEAAPPAQEPAPEPEQPAEG